MSVKDNHYRKHCGKSVQIRSFFLVRIFPHLDWIRSTEYLSVFSPSVGKYGPEKTLYLDTLHAVKKNRNPNLISLINCFQQALLNNFNILEVQKMLCISFKLESFQPLTIFAKSFIVDVWLVSKYASDAAVCLLNSLIYIVFRFHYDIIVRILYVRSFVSHVVSFLFTAFWVTWRFKYQKHCVKSVLIWSYSGLHFPAFGLNMERYSDTHSEWGIIRTRKARNTDTFYAVKFDKKPNKLSWPLKNIHETLEQNIRSNLRFIQTSTEWKVSKYGVFSGPYFLAFGLNTKRCYLYVFSPNAGK